MARRVLVTGLWHETNSFAAAPTDLAAFEAYQLVRGEAMAAAFAGTNTEIGGMIAAAAELGLHPCFGLFAAAVPAGLVTREAYEALVEETCRRAAALAPVDGALIALHGAMVAEGEDDADAALLARLRRTLGRACPLVATFDIHANLSPALFASADALIGYDTYPHTDMAARGREAAALLAEILATGRRPAKAFRKLPLLTVPQVQATAEPPLRAAIARLHALEAGPDLRTGSIAVGFPYADVAQLGVAVVGYGDEPGAVAAAVEQLASAIWASRHDFVPELVPAERAVRAALAAPERPVVLVDVADNVGGGAPGDGTVLLQALLAAGARDAVVVLWAPRAAARCLELGVGARFAGLVGDPPVAIEGGIGFAAHVEYRRRSSYMTGQLVRLGAVAVVVAAGVQVVLTEQRAMPFDADHLEVLGIAPAAARCLVCKSAIGWRAAFGDIARHHVFVDTPGICASDLTRFAYTKGQSALFPLDPDARWPAGHG
jgi:microcystin degradation protein MlrC